MAQTQYGSAIGAALASGILSNTFNSTDAERAVEPSIRLPIKVQLCLTVCNVESGYVVTTNDMTRNKHPKVYAGSSLEQCVKEILAEVIARKLEA